MLRVFNLKLYRKFLVLAVLLSGLYAVSSVNRAATAGCCEDCQPAYLGCIYACHSSNPDNPGKAQQCVETVCDPARFACITSCALC